MSSFLKIYIMYLSDFKHRIRKTNFFIFLAIVIFLGPFIIPATGKESNLVLLINGIYKPIYNSQFIGITSTVATLLIVSLLGFYIINSAIKGDISSNVCDIISSTSTRKSTYIISKFISNVTILTIILFINMLMTIFLYFLRSDQPINIIELISPFIVLGIPIIMLISALGVFFESINLLRSLIGDILYFISWLIVIGLSVLIPAKFDAFDIIGLNLISQNFKKSFNLSEKFVGFSWSKSSGMNYKSVYWDGIKWNYSVIINKAPMILLSLFLVILSIIFFDRFKNSKYSLENRSQSNNLFSEIRPANNRVKLSIKDLLQVRLQFKYTNLIMAELKVIFLQFKLGILIFIIILNIIAVFLPVDMNLRLILPVLWVLPIYAWSLLGCKNAMYNTDDIIKSCPKSFYYKIANQPIVGFIICIFASVGVIINLIINNKAIDMIQILSFALLIATLANCFGILFKHNKPFQIIYMLIIYLGPINNVNLFNYTGIVSSTLIIKSLLYLVISLILIMISILFEIHEAKFR